MARFFRYNEDKLDFIIDYKSLTNIEIASKFGLTSGFVSRMRNHNYGVLKNVHLFAFESAYGIPYEIFENESIDSEEKIVELLGSYKKGDKKEVQKVDGKNDEILKDLCGEWYYYCYSSNENFADIWKNKIIINKDFSAVYYNYSNNKNKTKVFTGNIVINKNRFIITIEISRSTIYIICDNDKVSDNIFFVILVSKSISNGKSFSQFGIFSKNKLPSEIAKYILGDREKNQLILDYKFQDRIIENFNFNSQKPLQVKKTLYDKDIILSKLIGKWYLTAYKTKRKHYFEIDENLKVEWFANGEFQEEGKLTINKFYSIIECTDKRGVNSYFLFKSMSEDIKICCFKSTIYHGHKDIMGIGILSRKELCREMVEEILISKEKSEILVDEFRDRLLNIMFP